MKKLPVSSLPIDDVIKDMAKGLGVDYTCVCDEYTIHIPKNLGSGEIYGIMFDSGLGMINYEVTFNQKVQIHFVKNNVHPIKAIFCYEGMVAHCFADDKDSTHTVHKFQNALVASKTTGGHILTFPKNVPVKFNSIEINREAFRQRFSCPISTVPEDIQELFNDIHAGKAFYYLGDYSLEISGIIHNIRAYKGNDFLRRMFLEAKGYELLTLQLAQYIDDKKEPGFKEILRGSDVKLINEAANYLMQNIKEYITIPDLSQKFGINERKLQQGFQHLYGKTINNFMQDYRVETGGKLLLSSDLNVSEILREVGITNSSYFAKIFKQRYGTTPKAFQMKYKGKSGN